MSKIIQCVVRTGISESGYCYKHNTETLSDKLAEGYTVVMCNKITLKDREWLEYILQKEQKDDRN